MSERIRDLEVVTTMRYTNRRTLYFTTLLLMSISAHFQQVSFRREGRRTKTRVGRSLTLRVSLKLFKMRSNGKQRTKSYTVWTKLAQEVVLAAIILI